ncbi:MAG: hypothetical protein WEA29_07600 [Acidimicrobiia bacterium]
MGPVRHRRLPHRLHLAGSDDGGWLQLATVVGGHVIGVVLAHDRALAVFSGPRAVRSQYAMLILMIGLTALALTLLAVN